MEPSEWFAAHIPPGWGAQAIEVLRDADEMLVVVDLDCGRADDGKEGKDGKEGNDATVGRGGPAPEGPAGAIAHFRDDTREERMALAATAESLFGMRVSWGARLDSELAVFTTATVPVMTRLRLPERRVLDTLIDGGLARTRSEALAWCVRLVGEHEQEWLAELRSAFSAVEEVRRKGPRSRRPGRPRPS